ncbi:MAG: S1 RNA-binding domain-containing protein [Clostridiales bacterium]|nr:S1 RNA-binding domain-containing protein [Clostridiales bacterium]
MIKLGETQTLVIEKDTEHGCYLKEMDQETEEHILLPKSQVPEGAAPGDEVTVFVYKDSEDRMIATCRTPKLKLHEVGFLTVAQVGRIGAFLDWGLDKDLLLPFHEQPRDARVKEGQECLVAVYIDKSARLCATMNVYPYLEKESPYKMDDRVTGTVYETSENFGIFVAVDNRYSALIPRKELVRDLRIGEVISARVTKVLDDGKLNLSLRERAFDQMGTDGERLMRMIKNGDGKLPFTDKAEPELIRSRTQMSKNEFKRAVGHLMKQGLVEIKEDGIYMTEAGIESGKEADDRQA